MSRGWATSGFLLVSVFATACDATIGAPSGPLAPPATDAGGVAPPVNQPPPPPPPPETEVDIPFAPVAPLVRRLTTDELANTVRDVLGVSLSGDVLAQLPVERPLEGFVNIASGQTVLPEHVLAYAAVAEAVAESPALAGFIATHTDCTEATAACGASFATGALTDLHRRPALVDDVETFRDLYLAVRSEAADHDEAARVVVQAILQTPRFLYLVESEGGGRVGGYEMASRLSYSLWATAPDGPLYAAAASGALDSPPGVAAQVSRMLESSDKTVRVLDRFIVDWARLASIPDDDGLKDDLTATTQSFFRDKTLEGVSVFAQLADPTAYLTPELAAAYGATPAGAGIQPYDVSELPGRGGLLAQPGVIAGMTNADGGAIVARGLFLQGQLFCLDTPDPPASLQEAIDEFVAEQPDNASDRQIAETRLERNECAACHAQFDPLAYGFEQFNFRGAYRTEDEYGNQVRTDGWIPGAFTVDEQPFNYTRFDVYLAALAENTRVRNCLVQRHMEHLLGHKLGPLHRGSVRDVRKAVEESDGTYGALVRALTSHEIFFTVEAP